MRKCGVITPPLSDQEGSVPGRGVGGLIAAVLGLAVRVARGRTATVSDLECPVPFKANADRRHHIPRQKFKVTNWRAYDACLRQRGSLTVWFNEEAIAAWRAEPRTTRGGQPTYSGLAILTALTLRAVFRLALYQTEGLIGYVIGLLGLDLAVPDHSTLSRRAATVEVPRPRTNSGAGPLHLLVDSTGLKLCGAGEWLHERHGAKIRRSWRELHLGLDAGTGRVVASLLTTRDVDDGSQVDPLLDRIEEPLASFTGDGAYDQERRHRQHRLPPPGRRHHRAAALHRGAERHGPDRAHAA